MANNDRISITYFKSQKTNNSQHEKENHRLYLYIPEFNFLKIYINVYLYPSNTCLIYLRNDFECSA